MQQQSPQGMNSVAPSPLSLVSTEQIQKSLTSFEISHLYDYGMKCGIYIFSAELIVFCDLYDYGSIMPKSYGGKFWSMQLLDENKNLIMAILESQKVGKMAECAQYQAILQKNLMYLAAIADAQPQGSAVPPSQLPTSSLTPPGSHVLQSHATTVQQQQVGVPVAKLPFQLNSLRSQDQQNQLLQFQQQQLQGHFGLGGIANNGMHLLMQPGAGGSGNLMELRGSQLGALESNSGDGHGHSALGSVDGRE